MSKEVAYEKEARESIKQGVVKLSKAVKITLGGRGRNVLIQSPHGDDYQITKDGVTVAKAFELNDPLEDLGCKVIKQVSLNTNDEVGDGTTTSIVLAEAMMTEGINFMDKGRNPIALKRGMDKATAKIVEYLKEIAKPVDGDTDFIRQIATVSANNDSSIGNLIAKAFETVGKHGVIKLDESKVNENFITHTEGLGFDRGYLHPIFTGDINSDTVELENPVIIVTDYMVKDLSDFKIENNQVVLFEELKKLNRPLLIICDDMDILPQVKLGEAMMKRELINVVVKAPEFGFRRTDVLGDIAAVTGAKFITKDAGLKLSDLTIDMLGGADSVVITANDTSISNGHGENENVGDRIKHIKLQLRDETEEFAINKLEERLAKLTGGVATLNIGANSEVELKELKDRVEDALNATKAAIAEGVVAGGGVALFQAVSVLRDLEIEDEDEQAGVEVISKAILSPLLSILENAGELKTDLIDKITDSDNMNFGYDVKERKFVDMFEAGIIDPVKVTRTALENSSSIASTLLTTECAIYNDFSDKEKDLIPQF